VDIVDIRHHPETRTRNERSDRAVVARAVFVTSSEQAMGRPS
jgi:hypothetical protein